MCDDLWCLDSAGGFAKWEASHMLSVWDLYGECEYTVTRRSWPTRNKKLLVTKGVGSNRNRTVHTLFSLRKRARYSSRALGAKRRQTQHSVTTWLNRDEILPQIHTQPVLQVSHGYTLKHLCLPKALEKSTSASVQCKGTPSALEVADLVSWTSSDSPTPSYWWQSRSACLLRS